MQHHRALCSVGGFGTSWDFAAPANGPELNMRTEVQGFDRMLLTSSHGVLLGHSHTLNSCRLAKPQVVHNIPAVRINKQPVCCRGPQQSCLTLALSILCLGQVVRLVVA